MSYHRILRLPPHVVDPIEIIAAAYVRLKRLRSGELNGAVMERQRQVGLIVVARDMLLQRVIDGRRATRRSRSINTRLVLERVDRLQRGRPELATSGRGRHGAIFGDGMN